MSLCLKSFNASSQKAVMYIRDIRDYRSQNQLYKNYPNDRFRLLSIALNACTIFKFFIFIRYVNHGIHDARRGQLASVGIYT